MSLSKEAMEMVGRLANRNRLNKIERFRQLNRFSSRESLTMIGDSMIENFPSDELLREYKIYNRGFGGDTSADMLERLPYTALGTGSKSVLVEVGTNDLGQGKPTEEVISHLKELKVRLPGVKITLLSVFPVNEKDRLENPESVHMTAGKDNRKIASLNGALTAFAKEEDLGFIDVRKEFTDETGRLKAEYTTDGVHLNMEGYFVLCGILKQHMNKEIGYAGTVTRF